MTYIIAEAGVNHNGSLQTAFDLINEAKSAGADCIKFQTFKAENLVLKSSPKANYQLKTTNKKESQYEMLKKLEISYDNFSLIKKECVKRKIDFISTPYSFEDVDFLDSIGVKYFKIASGQLTEKPFVEYVASKKREIILSTGMAKLNEVVEAVDIIKNQKINTFVLQCNTNYPSNISDANLRAMITMRDALKIPVGYSDHVSNNYASFAAVALGAVIIEKHFTLNKNNSGPDHSSSCDPQEFKNLVYGIRNIELSLGDGIKKPSVSEMKNAPSMKRSIVLKRKIKKGEVITINDVEFKRPANGLNPNLLYKIIGKEVINDFNKDTPLNFKMIKW
tara:strand:+ start:14246 stop:15250 length:1005 start_codon:yes stop_codon:yes gene_type:complete